MSNLLLDNNDLLWIKAVAGIDTAEAKRHLDNILSVGRAFRILNTLIKTEAKLAKAHSDIRCMVEKAAAKHRPAYDEQSMKIMKLEAKLKRINMCAAVRLDDCPDMSRLEYVVKLSDIEAAIKGAE